MYIWVETIGLRDSEERNTYPPTKCGTDNPTNKNGDSEYDVLDFMSNASIRTSGYTPVLKQKRQLIRGINFFITDHYYLIIHNPICENLYASQVQTSDGLVSSFFFF